MQKVSTKTTKRVAAIILAAFAACSVMGCSVEKNFTVTETHTEVDANGNETTTTTTNNNGEVTTETTETTVNPVGAEDVATEEVEGVGDIIEDMDFAIFDNDVFSFQYDPEYFAVMEDEEYVTVSFYNEETQTAGSNTITFKQVENADAMDVAKELAKQYGADEESVHELNFGMVDGESYAFSIFPTAESESGNQTRVMGCAVANGNNAIAVEVNTHVEPDEGMDMFINDKIAEVLDTFTVR